MCCIIICMSYHHTQQGRWHHVFLVLAAALVAGALYANHKNPNGLDSRKRAALDAVLVAAAVFAFCGLIFGSLTVRDEGDRLALRYGPLPLLFKTFRYADITNIEIGRTRFIDGWGIHCVPGRGWTYNLWGYDCVKLTLERKSVRIGSDDAKNLAKFLGERTGLSGLAE
jgi:hypothetical protein